MVISPVCASMENFGRSPGELTNVYVIVPPLSGGSLSNALTWQWENIHVWDLSESEKHITIIIIVIIVDIIIIIIIIIRWTVFTFDADFSRSLSRHNSSHE